MSVEINDGGNWKQIRSDSHFDTWYKIFKSFKNDTIKEPFFNCERFHWRRTGKWVSQAETRWDVPADALDGEYRFVHYGYWKSPDGKTTAYTGTSNSFRVIIKKDFLNAKFNLDILKQFVGQSLSQLVEILTKDNGGKARNIIIEQIVKSIVPIIKQKF